MTGPIGPSPKFRLSAVAVVPVRWPLERPFVTALGAKSFTDNVVVKARLSGGAVGYGEASSSLAMPWQTQAKMAAALSRLGRRFHGRDVRALDKIVRDAWRREPGTPTAAAAFECALTDAFCRQEKIPFHRFFGGARRTLETLMSVSAVTPASVADRVRAGRREGFTVFKLKLNGGEAAAVNVGRVRAAHRAAPRARLLLDPNQSYRPASLESLLAALHRDGLPVDLVEEPFRKRSWAALASFRSRTAARAGGAAWERPVILDESVQNVDDARRVVRRELADGVNVKLAKSGLTASREIAGIFKEGGRTTMIGCMAESPIGLAAAVQFAMGWGAFDYCDLDSDLLLKPVSAPGGYLRRGPEILLPPRPAPGLGMAWT